MNAVRGHPENRAAFESERGENRHHIFDPLGSFVTAVSEQAVIADADADAGGEPPENNRYKKSLPGKKEKCNKRADMKEHHEGSGDPIDFVVARLLLFQILELNRHCRLP